MTEYIRAAGLKMDSSLATALFYGIKTDPMGLGRDTDSTDTRAFCSLLPKIDPQALFKIEHAQVPNDYFKSFTTTLQAAHVYEGIIISYIGSMGYPDLVAEMADLLLRRKGSQWVVCMGAYENSLILSVRSYSQRGSGQLVQKVVGKWGTAGGHGSMAGESVPLNGEDPEKLAQYFSQRALRYLQVSPEKVGNPLI